MARWWSIVFLNSKYIGLRMNLLGSAGRGRVGCEDIYVSSSSMIGYGMLMWPWLTVSSSACFRFLGPLFLNCFIRETDSLNLLGQLSLKVALHLHE
jgi:hypothetical protein